MKHYSDPEAGRDFDSERKAVKEGSDSRDGEVAVTKEQTYVYRRGVPVNGTNRYFTRTVKKETR